MFFDTLTERIHALGNPTVAGLDPKPEHLPEALLRRHLEGADDVPAALAAAYLEFNRGLIDALCDIVPAVKPQSAYYEALGWQGVRCFAETCAYARSRGMLVIADCKRNDIGSTAQAYSQAYLGRLAAAGQRCEVFECDAVTVNAYLGSDGVKPFLEDCKEYGKGIFALVKTSNPSSGELQDMRLENGLTVYQHMGRLLETLAADTVGACGYSAVGAVVGATYPKELGQLRRELAHTFFLVPGYGAQGGGAQDAAFAFDEKGGGAIINSSRAIMCAYKKTGGEYADAARQEALNMRDALRGAVRGL